MRPAGYDPAALATLDELLDLDVRVGTVVAVRPLRGARRPTLALTLDLGPGGRRLGCLESGSRDEPDQLVGLQVAAVVNLPPRVVAGTEVDAWLLSAADGQGNRVLLLPERPLAEGSRVFEEQD